MPVTENRQNRKRTQLLLISTQLFLLTCFVDVSNSGSISDFVILSYHYNSDALCPTGPFYYLCEWGSSPRPADNSSLVWPKTALFSIATHTILDYVLITLKLDSKFLPLSILIQSLFNKQQKYPSVYLLYIPLLLLYHYGKNNYLGVKSYSLVAMLITRWVTLVKSFHCSRASCFLLYKMRG